jgi:hypothetical protein
MVIASQLGLLTAHRAGLFRCVVGGPPTDSAEAHVPDDLRVMLHIFFAVLIMGTLWRLASYHFIASKQPHLNHLGQAMATQY